MLLNPALVRDHLANERTYQAWMRSAIALIGFGVIIVRFRIYRLPIPFLPHNGLRMGLLFSIVGMATLFLSVHHYFSVRDTIEGNTYQPADQLVILFSLVVMLLSTGVLYYVFAVPLEFSSQLLIE